MNNSRKTNLYQDITVSELVHPIHAMFMLEELPDLGQRSQPNVKPDLVSIQYAFSRNITGDKRM